jgi:hypothetical protein
MWQRITDGAALPEIGAAESETLEFKREGYAASDRGKIELACDVAQFANAFGGVILIGAEASASRLATYRGIPQEELDKLESRITSIVAERIEPAVAIDVRRIVAGSTMVLAANVSPSIATVAVRVSEGRYTFPVRRGTQRYFLRFSEVEEMIVLDRRAQLMLESIPVPNRSTITLDMPPLTSPREAIPMEGWSLGEIAARHFVLSFPSRMIDVRIPHTLLQSAWPSDARGAYTLSIRARLALRHGPVGDFVQVQTAW